MRNGGAALMGTGVANGADAAEEAARMAIHSPLLDDVSIQGATSILVNITGPRSLGIRQISRAATVINSEAGAGAHVFLGTVIDESMPEGEMRPVIATGFHRPSPAAHVESRPAAAARVEPPRTLDISPRAPEPRMREWQPAPAAPMMSEPDRGATMVRESAPVAPVREPVREVAPVAMQPMAPAAPMAMPVEHAARMAEPVARMEPLSHGTNVSKTTSPSSTFRNSRAR
jgi:cell division protein FtsZ